MADALSRMGFRVIHLSKLVVEERLYRAYDKRRQAYIIDEERLAERMRKLADIDGLVIVEGIGAEALPPDIVSLCIVLTCEPFALRERLERRNFPPEKIEENLEAERFGIILGEAISNYGSSKVIVIDTTYREISDIVGEILDELKKRGIIQ